MTGILSFAAIFSLMGFSIAFAEVQLTPGKVNISMGGILIDVTGSIASMDQIVVDTAANTITVQMINGQNLTFSSSDRRAFSISPTTATTLNCTSGASTVALAPTGSVTYIISPQSATCTSSDGGSIGGSGSLSTFNFGPAPEESLVATPTEPTPEPVVEPVVTTEPTTITEPAPEPIIEPTPTTEPVAEEIISSPIITETIQAIEQTYSEVTTAAVEIAGGVTEVTSAVGGAITEVYYGLIGETVGTGYISPETTNDGAYDWNTAEPLQPESGYPLLTVTEGTDYTITISSATDPTIQDTVSFSFVSETGQTARSGKFFPSIAKLFRSSKAIAADSPAITITYPLPGENLIVGDTYTIRWKSTDQKNIDNVKLRLTKDFVLADTARAVVKKTEQAVQTLRENPTVVSTIREIAVPTTMAAAATSATLITVTTSTSSVAVAFDITLLQQFFSLARFYFFGLIRIRRKKPWGKVTDKLSGEPIPNCTVQIFDAEFNKLKDVQITDGEGAFSAVIGSGRYFLKISKRGFETVETEPVEISSQNDVINMDIALSPTVEILSFKALRKISILNAIRRFLDAINPYLLILGTVLSIISATLMPNGLNLTVLVLYIILDAMKIWFAFHLVKPFGTVRSGKNNSPLPLAVVRIFNEDQNRLLATKVTDAEGRFNLLLAPGRYYATCIKSGFSPFRSETIILKEKGTASLDIRLN